MWGKIYAKTGRVDCSDITSEVIPSDRAEDVLKFGAKNLQADAIYWDNSGGPLSATLS